MLIINSFVKFFLLACFIFLLPQLSHAQLPADTVPAIRATDSLQKIIAKQKYQQLLDSNIFVNARREGMSFPTVSKKNESPVYFYVIAGLLLFLGIMKTLYSRYFNTLFRVFFNTSLRQNQLTDQLEQAKIPSLLFNIFFVLSAGLYLYLLVGYYGATTNRDVSPWQWCIPAAVACCYFVKYLTLRFTGWITNYKAEAGTYIFIVFLLNKVIGILLLPFIIILLFGSASLASYAVFISIIMLSLILLLRFFRSWSLLQNRLKVTRFHFFLYIISLEILPIALIYKAVMLFLGKSS